MDGEISKVTFWLAEVEKNDVLQVADTWLTQIVCLVSKPVLEACISCLFTWLLMQNY